MRGDSISLLVAWRVAQSKLARIAVGFDNDRACSIVRGQMGMDAEAIGRQYDQIADHWQEPHLQSNGIAQFEKAIRFTKNRGLALDIGCGSGGRFIDLLSRHGFAPEGLDVSQRMIALAREMHPHIRFYQADICRWDFPKKYDFVSAWDSTWHLPLNLQEAVLRRICDGLADNGVFIFTTGGLDAPGEKSDSFMGVELSYSALGIPKTLELLARFGCACRHLEYDQHPQQHVVYRSAKSRLIDFLR
jgi:SAM-dependent methyltransferase